MDVKSLFKSGKKSIKAFKIASGPVTEAKEEKSIPESLEAWEAPAPAKALQPVNINVGVDDYKAEEEQQNAKPGVSWTSEETTPVVEEAPLMNARAYVPPSQRRAETGRAMPSLSDAAKLASASTKPVPAAVPSVAGGPSRLKLITSATKKAQEEEEKRKEEDRKRKEAEKQARKEELRAQMERAVSAGSTSVTTEAAKIQPATLEQVYAKYIGRAKNGRKLAPVA